MRDLHVSGKIIQNKDMVPRKVRIVMAFGEEDEDVIRGHVGELLGLFLMTSVVTTMYSSSDSTCDLYAFLQL